MSFKNISRMATFMHRPKIRFIDDGNTGQRKCCHHVNNWRDICTVPHRKYGKLIFPRNSERRIILLPESNGHMYRNFTRNPQVSTSVVKNWQSKANERLAVGIARDSTSWWRVSRRNYCTWDSGCDMDEFSDFTYDADDNNAEHLLFSTSNDNAEVEGNDGICFKIVNIFDNNMIDLTKSGTDGEDYILLDSNDGDTNQMDLYKVLSKGTLETNQEYYVLEECDQILDSEDLQQINKYMMKNQDQIIEMKDNSKIEYIPGKHIQKMTETDRNEKLPCQEANAIDQKLQTLTKENDGSRRVGNELKETEKTSFRISDMIKIDLKNVNSVGCKKEENTKESNDSNACGDDQDVWLKKEKSAMASALLSHQVTQILDTADSTSGKSEVADINQEKMAIHEANRPTNMVKSLKVPNIIPGNNKPIKCNEMINKSASLEKLSTYEDNKRDKSHDPIINCKSRIFSNDKQVDWSKIEHSKTPNDLNSIDKRHGKSKPEEQKPKKESTKRVTGNFFNLSKISKVTQRINELMGRKRVENTESKDNVNNEIIDNKKESNIFTGHSPRSQYNKNVNGSSATGDSEYFVENHSNNKEIAKEVRTPNTFIGSSPSPRLKCDSQSIDTANESVDCGEERGNLSETKRRGGNNDSMKDLEIEISAKETNSVEGLSGYNNSTSDAGSQEKLNLDESLIDTDFQVRETSPKTLEENSEMIKFNKGLFERPSNSTTLDTNNCDSHEGVLEGDKISEFLKEKGQRSDSLKIEKQDEKVNSITMKMQDLMLKSASSYEEMNDIMMKNATTYNTGRSRVELISSKIPASLALEQADPQTANKLRQYNHSFQNLPTRTISIPQSALRTVMAKNTVKRKVTNSYKVSKRMTQTEKHVSRRKDQPTNAYLNSMEKTQSSSHLDSTKNGQEQKRTVSQSGTVRSILNFQNKKSQINKQMDPKPVKKTQFHFRNRVKFAPKPFRTIKSNKEGNENQTAESTENQPFLINPMMKLISKEDDSKKHLDIVSEHKKMMQEKREKEKTPKEVKSLVNPMEKYRRRRQKPKTESRAINATKSSVNMIPKQRQPKQLQISNKNINYTEIDKTDSKAGDEKPIARSAILTRKQLHQLEDSTDSLEIKKLNPLPSVAIEPTPLNAEKIETRESDKEKLVHENNVNVMDNQSEIINVQIDVETNQTKGQNSNSLQTVSNLQDKKCESIDVTRLAESKTSKNLENIVEQNIDAQEMNAQENKIQSSTSKEDMSTESAQLEVQVSQVVKKMPENVSAQPNDPLKFQAIMSLPTKPIPSNGNQNQFQVNNLRSKYGERSHRDKLQKQYNFPTANVQSLSKKQTKDVSRSDHMQNVRATSGTTSPVGRESRIRFPQFCLRKPQSPNAYEPTSEPSPRAYQYGQSSPKKYRGGHSIKTYNASRLPSVAEEKLQPRKSNLEINHLQHLQAKEKKDTKSLLRELTKHLHSDTEERKIKKNISAFLRDPTASKFGHTQGNDDSETATTSQKAAVVKQRSLYSSASKNQTFLSNKMDLKNRTAKYSTGSALNKFSKTMRTPKELNESTPVQNAVSRTGRLYKNLKKKQSQLMSLPKRKILRQHQSSTTTDLRLFSKLKSWQQGKDILNPMLMQRSNAGPNQSTINLDDTNNLSQISKDWNIDNSLMGQVLGSNKTDKKNKQRSNSIAKKSVSRERVSTANVMVKYGFQKKYKQSAAVQQSRKDVGKQHKFVYPELKQTLEQAEEQTKHESAEAKS